jgi:hypothetical protein
MKLGLLMTLILSGIMIKVGSPDKKKWTPLFDGKTTKGWHTYGAAGIGEAWKVKDGILYLDTLGKDGWKIKGGGDIVTDKEYENFHLSLEWNISKGGNSGIMIYVHEDMSKYPNSYETGPEMQILDNDGHPDGKIHKHRAGDLYDLIPCKVETAKPFGQWNHAEIISKDGKLTFILNKVKVVETTMWNESWKEMISKSKFNQWPGFGTFKRGRICLQDHGNMVQYRNIKIKEL